MMGPIPIVIGFFVVVSFYHKSFQQEDRNTKNVDICNFFFKAILNNNPINPHLPSVWIFIPFQIGMQLFSVGGFFFHPISFSIFHFKKKNRQQTGSTSHLKSCDSVGNRLRLFLFQPSVNMLCVCVGPLTQAT